MKAPASWITIPSITIPQLIIKYLQLEGVDRLFGIPGGSFPDLLEQLYLDRASMHYVVCKHETGAGYMADGFHRVSGKLAVVLVTAGPGATNALTGAMNAQAGYTPMLVMTGEQPQSSYGLDWEQEGVDLDLDVLQVYKSAVAYSALTPSPPDFSVLFRQALRDALGRPGQAVHLSIPHDVMASTVTNEKWPTAPSLYRRSADSASTADVLSVAKLMLAAQRPAILLGNGTRDALDAAGLRAFQAMVERLGVPVVTTSDAKALFPERHPLSLRTFGYPPCQWPGLYFTPPAGTPNAAPYDFLLVLGSSMGDFATNLWDPALIPAGPFVQVDVNQRVLARSMPVTVPVIAELGAFIASLAAVTAGMTPNASARTARLAYLTAMKQAHSPYANPAARDSDAAPIRPERAMKIVSEMLPPGSHIFPDAGNSCGWTAHYLELDPPTRIHPALDVGAMGYATCAVVGAKLAAPEATCLSIGGDGSFLMHGSEVTTAKQYRAGAIWMVWSENDLNMVDQSMAGRFPTQGFKDYYALGNPDLVKVAEGYGATAYLVKTPAELKVALARAIAGGKTGQPQVIVMKQDASARPPFLFGPPQGSPAKMKAAATKPTKATAKPTAKATTKATAKPTAKPKPTKPKPTKPKKR